MCDGEVFVWRASLGILRLQEKRFLKLDFEGLVRELRHLPPDIGENHLFDAIQGIEVTQAQFEAIKVK